MVNGVKGSWVVQKYQENTTFIIQLTKNVIMHFKEGRLCAVVFPVRRLILFI